MRASCGVLLVLGCTSQSVVVVAPFVDAGDATRDVAVLDRADALDTGDDAPTAGDVPASQDVVACPGVLQRCGASCVDTHIDPAHCGGCGHVCAVGVGCTRGICNDRVVDMAVGFGHVCVLHANGELGCWGRNTSGQLGDASLSDRATPTRTMGVSGASHVAVGVLHTCVVATSAREVLCWGANDRGQLGNGARDDSPLPVLVAGSRGATAVALGELFSCFAAGQVWCWGDNSTGQLGDGATAARRLPAPAGVLTAAVDVGCGQEHACALQDGRVFCWGRNNNGEAGIGMTGEALRTPQEVMGLRGVAQLAVGQAHACARVRGDGVWCWGNNHLGQLGDGTRIARAAPVRVAEPELLDAKWIVAAPGGSHTCALDGRGRLWCWGANTFGQVGTGAMATEILSPTRVVIPMGVEPMERVRLGDSASCALSETGAVWCWGEPSVFLPGETVAVRTARRLPWFGR